MPIYEFKCPACGHTCEQLTSKTSWPCQCGAEMVKQFSTFEARYVGTGFYSNNKKLEDAKAMGLWDERKEK